MAYPVPLSSNKIILVFILLIIFNAIFSFFAPIAISIISVFIFAGPHNWFEFRYFLGRLPGRPGKLWPWFFVSVSGIAILSFYFILLTYLNFHDWIQESSFKQAVVIWNYLLIGWLAVLAYWRSLQNPRKNIRLLIPIFFLAICINGISPYFFGFLLIYLHPIMGILILDREIFKSRRCILNAFRYSLVIVPIVIGVFWFYSSYAPNLPDSTEVSKAIIENSGVDLFFGVSTHFLVSTHVFLEILHYIIWIVFIPLIGWRSKPWELHKIPFAYTSIVGKRIIASLLGLGVFIVFLFWIAFMVDYACTRQIYFTLAIIHVLAEFPFLIRIS